MDRLQRVNGSGEEGVGAFLEGAFLGGFSDSDSWSTVVGSTAVGFIPVVGQIADIRDLAAAVMHVAEGEDGAWLELGASTLGVVPGLDFAKGMAKGATRAGKEALEGVVTRGAAELAAAGGAATRAGEIQNLLKPRTQRSVTTAVTETREGVRVVTSSEGRLRPAQRTALQPGEIAGVGQRGIHAEINGVNAAKGAGLTPTGVAPSRPACPACKQALDEMGVPIIGP